MARAAWTVTVRKRSVDPDGTAVLHAEVADGGKRAADVTITITADRALRLDVALAPGAAGLTGFEAWMKEATP